MIKIIFLLLLFFLSFLYSQENKKHILILHSYSQEYKWTKLQHTGFVSTLEKSFSSPVDISVEYLDTKRLMFTDNYQLFFFHYLQGKYNGTKLDAVYVTDDNALDFIINFKNKLFQNIPIFFSGINNLELINTLDLTKFTGVYETKDIEPNIKLIHEFSPQSHDIWFIGDTSNTYKSIEQDIKTSMSKFTNYTFHFISFNNIDDIINHLPSKPKSFVVLTTIGGFSDGKGESLLPKESIKRLKQNKNIIVCSMEDSYMVGDVVGGYVTSGKQHGSKSAELMIRYFNGESLQTIKSITKSPNIYMFDRKALTESRLILSEYIRRNAVILHENKTFFERYEHVILNTFFILFVFFLLFLLVVFLIALQKNALLKTLKINLENCTGELAMMKEKFSLFKNKNE